jgi:hypothetical protein
MPGKFVSTDVKEVGISSTQLTIDNPHLGILQIQECRRIGSSSNECLEFSNSMEAEVIYGIWNVSIASNSHRIHGSETEFQWILLHSNEIEKDPGPFSMAALGFENIGPTPIVPTWQFARYDML